jgi:hypothetical protein
LQHDFFVLVIDLVVRPARRPDRPQLDFIGLSNLALHPPARSSVNQFVIERAWLPELNLLAICRTPRLPSRIRVGFFARSVTSLRTAPMVGGGYAWAVYR